MTIQATARRPAVSGYPANKGGPNGHRSCHSAASSVKCVHPGSVLPMLGTQDWALLITLLQDSSMLRFAFNAAFTQEDGEKQYAQAPPEQVVGLPCRPGSWCCHPPRLQSAQARAGRT